MKVKKLVIAGLLGAALIVAILCSLIYLSFEKKSKELMDINLYYYNPSINTLVAEKRSIPKTEDRNETLANVEEAYRQGPKNPAMVKAIPDELEFEIINNDETLENVVSIRFSDNFNDLTESQRLLSIGSVVYTFSDISFINNVQLFVGDKNIVELYDMYGGQSTLLNRDNVVNNPVINPEKINRQKVVLYFIDSEGKKLVPEERSIEVKQSQTSEYQIVEQLLLGPETEEYKASVPQGTKINDIKTEEGICYVNLSKDFLNKLTGTVNDEKLAIYSIVNSLTELNSVNKVQFLIEGEKVSEFKGKCDLSKTFEREESLIGK